MLTKSAELTLKKVDLDSVATALAKKDFPVPGGPYNKIPLQGVLFPVNKCGNFIGKITASFNESFAASNPATSSHLIFGVSVMMAPVRRKREGGLSSVPLATFYFITPSEYAELTG